MASALHPSRVLKFGIFEVDLEAQELRKAGMRMKLSGQPFHVLQLLLEHPQQVVTREALKQRLWPDDTHVEYDVALKRVVNRLRDVLGDSAESPRFVETIPRIGYRFIAPVEAVGNGAGRAAAIAAAAGGSPPRLPFRIDARIWFPLATTLALSLLIAGWNLSPVRHSKFASRLLALVQAAPKGSSDDSRGNPVPIIYQPLNPSRAAPGAPAFTLNVLGSGFVSDSVVNWNGSPRRTTFVSGSQLRAEILASDLAKSGTASVSVGSPNAAGGPSNALSFSIGRPASSFYLTRTDFYAGLEANSVAVGDFNHDGMLDIAVANAGGGTISIHLGNGNGTFQPAVHYAIGQGPFAQLAVGDVNGDAELDLVAINYGSNTVSVLLGNGDGTFRPADTHNVGTNPASIAVADVNRDGKLDLLVANQNCTNGAPPCRTGTVSVLLGNGDGTFRTYTELPLPHPGNGVAVGDFNGDGHLDLAVVGGNAGDHQSPSVSILLGIGDGSFQHPASYPLAVNPGAIATADFNGDGKLDLIASDNIGLVSILLGKGDGTFLSRVDYPAGSFPAGSIAIGDFDGDGRLDAAVASSGSNSVSIFLGKGDGTFLPETVRFGTASNPQGVTAGDFNGNGRLDLAVPCRASNMVSVLLQ